MASLMWEWKSFGEGPLVASSIHDGHDLRPEVAELMALSDAERRREEDPFTARWTEVAPQRLVVFRSRFEVDLNRPRDKAVYLHPEDCWGLKPWKQAPSEALIRASLAEYDDFYAGVAEKLREVVRRHGRFVLLDIHSYNHYRNGPESAAEDAEKNPEVNLGTRSLDRARWGKVVDRFMGDLSGANYLGTRLDVRENIKFGGGHFSRWIHQNFSETGCALAIEFKKTFMNEWSGEPDSLRMAAIETALSSAVPGIMEELAKMGSPQ